MAKLLIGISGRQTRLYDHYSSYCYNSYYRYVSGQGGLPVQMGVVDNALAADYAAALDGLLITGGPDIDPVYYHEENTQSFPGLPEEDASDFALYRAFRDAGKPILLICRGMQVGCVAEGGKLYQDIRTSCPQALEHNQMKHDPPLARDCFAHTVRFSEGSVMAQIFGSSYGTNSFHHQACREVPACFQVTGVCADDGIIEAFENDQVLAVEWHPERHPRDEHHRKLMQVFLQRCASVREQTH